jgi:hypothetical protein
VSKDTDWVTQYDDDPEDDSDDRSRPPIWVVVVIALSVVTGAWLLGTQGSPDDDPVASPTTTVEASVVETTTTSVVTTTASTVAGGSVSVVGNPPASVTSQTPQQLRGYVAVASPGALSSQDTVWVFQPGGSVVSRGDTVIGRDYAEYPMLITAGRLIVGNQIFDIDLAEPPISLWTDASVYPGSGPGVVWLARHQGFSAADWVAQVDVESLTVGEQVTDVSSIPLFGVADGLIVFEFSDESVMFWSPTDGLVHDVLREDLDVVIAASGNVVVVVTPGGVNVLDIVSGEVVSSFELPLIDTRGGSACLSPDGQHVVIVGSNGEAAVGNITSGEVISLNEAIGNHPMDIERKHGIGWTTDDQLVFIGDVEGDAKHIFGFDVRTGESFLVATLYGPDWRLAASGTMC